MKCLLSAAVLLLLCAGVSAQGANSYRFFLGIGEPTPDAWKYMVEKPIDREVAMGNAMQALGGEMVAYYWGLANDRNYILAKFPDDPGMIQAMYVARLSQGVLKDYQFIELMTSADMVAALKRVPEFTAPLK